MAGIVTWEQLRELAGFRASRGCAVSLYVKLDPSEAPTPRDVDTRVNSLFDGGLKAADARRTAMTHEQREGLKADFLRIRNWFETDFDRQGGTQAVAVFAAGLDNFWTTLQLADPVEDEVKLALELYLAPLTPLVGRGDGTLVGVVSRERGELYKLDGGRLVEIANETEEVPGQHDQGGWSQARYERHIDEIVERHWRRIATSLDACVRKLGRPRIVLVGTEDMRSDFEQLLSHDAKQHVIGWTGAEAHADRPQILQAVRPMLDRWWAAQEQELLERWRAAAATNGRAAKGWEQTLEAASDGRIELLLVQSGADHPAYECPVCGRAQVANGSCPLDGATMESRSDGLDLAVHKTLAHGGAVHVVRAARDLEPVGGVGALLRF